MLKSLTVLLAAACLTACVPATPTSPRPDFARQFTLADGSRLTITTDSRQAQLRYPARYPLTDAETASYIEDATGCLPGRTLGSSFEGNDTLRSYALNCG